MFVFHVVIYILNFNYQILKIGSLSLTNTKSRRPPSPATRLAEKQISDTPFSFTSLINPYAQIVTSLSSRRCKTLHRPPPPHQSLSLLSTRSEYHTFLLPFKMVLELLAANTACLPLDLLVLDVAMASFNGLLAFVAFWQVSSSPNCK